ncbi:putative helicase [Tolypocladium ophioglossoides CBS 100239]|uniref:Putative helicase n=1 Tax=Tolypocladium ophioglossoides (strain CBS 100239) TaxID=1163406 RepID=A0A0L0MZ63_TOLOC|nr:putative helicase [Tolypocladium ophioglossoides CBS 100239]
MHLSILRRTNLSQRSCKETTVNELKQTALNDFLGRVDNLCTSIVENLSEKTRWDVFDLLDGRIFPHVFRYLNCLELPRCITKEVRQFAALVHQLTGVDISESIPPCLFPVSNETKETNFGTGDSVPLSLLPFTHQALDEYLSPIKLTTNDSIEPNSAQKVFQEVSHWHNAQVPVDVKHIPRPKGFFAMKKNQSLMADIIAYSASLANASGKPINPQIIVSVPAVAPFSKERKIRGEESAKSKQGFQQHKAKKPSSKSGRENAQIEAQRVQQEKLDSKANDVLKSWNKRCREFETEVALESHYLKATKGRRPVRTVLEGSKPSDHDGGLSFYEKRKLPFTSIMATSWIELKLPIDSLEFQLNYCGPYMERSFDQAPDPRVPFNPDAWQREVLDAIDANKSLFVVAPTSAGKTFISFYAMKKVLQTTDGILVYVAPTKALVNQIAAEVQARFSKTYSHASRSV